MIKFLFMFFIKRRNSKIPPLLPIVILICFYYFTTCSVIFSNKISPSHLKLPHTSDNDFWLPSSFPLLCLNSAESVHIPERWFFLLFEPPQNQSLLSHSSLRTPHILAASIREKQYFLLSYPTFFCYIQAVHTLMKHRKDNIFPEFLKYFFPANHNAHKDIW